MREEYLLVDTSCLFMTYAYLPRPLGVDNGLNGSLIFLKAMQNRYPSLRIILVLDDKINEGKILNEDYKGQRENKSHLYKNFDDFIVLSSKCWNVQHIVKGEGLEADKTIAVIANELVVNNPVLIYSKDNDFWQLAGKVGVTNKYLGKDEGFKIITKDDVMKKYGVEPDRLIFYRMLKGDVSDNLKPPVARVPSKKIIEIANSIDLDRVFEDKGLTKEYLVEVLDKYEDKKLSAKYLEAIDSIMLNYNIMDLYYCLMNNVDELESKVKVIKNNATDKVVMNLLEKYNIKKLNAERIYGRHR